MVLELYKNCFMLKEVELSLIPEKTIGLQQNISVVILSADFWPLADTAV